MSAPYNHQLLDSPRVSQSLCNDRCQNILYKAVFEHFKQLPRVAALLLSSKSFQNSSFGANFLLNFVVDPISIELFESVLSPSSCFSLQFVPSLHIEQWWNYVGKVDKSNFVREIVNSKYFRLSLRSLALKEVCKETISHFFGSSSNAWPQLQDLKFEKIAVNDDIVKIISKNALQLRTVHLLDKTGITDVGVEHISKLTNITSLSMWGMWGCSMVTDAGIEHLSNLSSITSLDLTGCNKISDAGLHCICTDLTSITTLHLCGCRSITDVGLVHVSTLSGITSLDLSWCPSITDAGLEHIAELSGITALNLSRCDEITDVGLEYVAKLARITSLRLSNRNITDVGLEHIAKLSRITFLDLDTCKKISDVGLEHISKLSGITSLDLSFCKKITDAGLVHVSRLSSITSLNLEYCSQITSAGLEHVAKLPNITTLLLACCNKITAAQKKKLKTALPKCVIGE